MVLYAAPPMILVVSADVGAAGRLGRVLGEYGVRAASDGMEGLRVLSDEGAPAVALIDCSLPDMSGVELAAEVKRRAKGSPPWIMLMCAQVDAATVASAMDAGVDDLLLKPVDEADLRVRLRVAERVQALMGQIDEQASAVRFHASHDSLTGLWNRESLLNLLFPETDRVQRMRTPLTLLLMDLDHFGGINAEYGYEAGDKILQELANRFRRFLRSYDLAGRMGEDEFLIAMPGCTAEQALAMAVRLKKTILGKPFAAGRDMLTLTASMGVAQSKGRSPLVVLREVERALAEAKRRGRNAIIEFRKDSPSRQEAMVPVPLESTDSKVLMPFPTER
jgi:two-component system, cell cycle response regulator